MAHKGRLNVMLVFALVVVSIQCACAAPWNHAKAAEQHQRLVLWTIHGTPLFTASVVAMDLPVAAANVFPSLSRQGALAARDHSPPSRRTLLYSSHNLTSSGLFLIHPGDKT